MSGKTVCTIYNGTPVYRDEHVLTNRTSNPGAVNQHQ
jgi:hypothetical protein